MFSLFASLFRARRLAAFAVGVFLFSLARADTYEVKLPPELSTSPRLCDYAPCAEVMPGATSFSERKGQPPYVEAYREEGGEKKPIGYVMLSTDITDIPAYSGKPVVTLIGMDTAGKFTGVKILKHSEPILLLGIPESSLIKFNHQYLGKFVGDNIEIGKSRPAENLIGLDAITGATVTVIAQNQVMMTSGGEVAKQVGILQPVVRPQASLADTGATPSWSDLVAEGSVLRLTVRADEVGLRSDGRPYMDLWFGYLNHPVIGRAVLGKDGYASLMSRLSPGEHAIFIIAANSMDSFKGSGFVRGGIYDRVQVRQERDIFTFRDLDYINLWGIAVPDAPQHNESAIFIIRNKNFSAAYPWKLVFLGNKIDQETGGKTFANFDKEYWLPAAYLQGGRPDYRRPDPAWLKAWKGRPTEVAGFLAFLAAAALLYANRDRLVRRARRSDKRWVSAPKYALWLVSIGFAGFGLLAQPSITQVLTWFHAILFEWQWELFLSDPFIFLFWWFIIISVFFWGRGMFCGWMCPYGALSELTFKVAGALGLKRWQITPPARIHEKLKWLKYLIFAGLLGTSFYSMGLAEKLAEVEPFKTTFLVGVGNRSWPFVTYWSLLLALALFIERPFCKYLCPLGASLAVPSTFRWWSLKRKQECGPCKACAAGCASLAIDKSGRIDQRECLLCLDCMVMYYDAHACPPLAKERKQRARAGQPLTKIGADGYFIPIRPVPATTFAEPHLGVLAWLRQEIIDHLLPWGSKFRQRHRLIQGASLGLATLVTWIWLLGAAGKLGPGIILGWWLAWSVYEVVARMNCKPYVKEGPWWGRHFRPAGWADMIAYVSFKNLLIGAALFLAMKTVGALAFLQGLPELKWLY